jgi:hypothetical protein
LFAALVWVNTVSQVLFFGAELCKVQEQSMTTHDEIINRTPFERDGRLPGLALLGWLRELTRKPRARELPVPHHSLRRSLQHLSGLFDRHPSKEPKLDHVSSSRIELRKHVERIVQRTDLSTHLRGRVRQLVEIDCRRVLRPINVPASFDRRTWPRCVDQNPSHDPRAYREKVCPIRKIQIPGINQAQKRLVHERSRLQGMPEALAPHVAARHPA